jgi:VanZ family protein
MNRCYLALAALYMALIFFLSSLPGGTVGIPAPWDKVAHALEYGGLGFLLGRGLGRPLPALWLAVLYGLSDELHQSFVPGREVSAGDLLADAVGALLGVRASRRP